MGLELHLEKTKVVYCKDANRVGDFDSTGFDFLCYTFRGRLARGRKGFFVSFLPAMSSQAKKAKGQQIRAWHLNRRTSTDLSGIANGKLTVTPANPRTQVAVEVVDCPDSVPERLTDRDVENAQARATR